MIGEMVKFYLEVGMDRLGNWLAPLGHLVSAALDRDLSADDQRNQVNYAHTELYRELRCMDNVRDDLLEALEEVAASLAWNAHGECRAIHDGPIMPSNQALDFARRAIARARGIEE